MRAVGSAAIDLARTVAPVTFASRFITSIAGVVTFRVLSVHHNGSGAPDWRVGIALGAGGHLGAYTVDRFPQLRFRRLLAVLVLAIGARYGWLAAS